MKHQLFDRFQNMHLSVPFKKKYSQQNPSEEMEVHSNPATFNLQRNPTQIQDFNYRSVHSKTPMHLGHYVPDALDRQISDL